MPGISILKLFTLFGIVSTWSEKALEDRKITLTEAAELAEQLGPLLGVPVDVYIATPSSAHFEPPELIETRPPALEGEDETQDEETESGGPDRSNLI